MTVTHSQCQVIRTRYLGPTDYLGARVRAVCQGGSVTHHYDHGLSCAENHAEACRALVLKMRWTGDWRGGTARDGDSYFVNLSA